MCHRSHRWGRQRLPGQGLGSDNRASVRAWGEQGHPIGHRIGVVLQSSMANPAQGRFNVCWVHVTRFGPVLGRAASRFCLSPDQDSAMHRTSRVPRGAFLIRPGPRRACGCEPRIVAIRAESCCRPLSGSCSADRSPLAWEPALACGRFGRSSRHSPARQAGECRPATAHPDNRGFAGCC
jgi:hypothetical protein